MVVVKINIKKSDVCNNTESRITVITTSVQSMRELNRQILINRWLIYESRAADHKTDGSSPGGRHRRDIKPSDDRSYWISIFVSYQNHTKRSTDTRHGEATDTRFRSHRVRSTKSRLCEFGYIIECAFYSHNSIMLST